MPFGRKTKTSAVKLRGVTAVLLSFVFGCACEATDEVTSPKPPSETLQLGHGVAGLSGTYTDEENGTKLFFQSVRIDSERARLSLFAGKERLDYHLDGKKGILRSETPGFFLDANRKGALARFSTILGQRLVSEGWLAPHEQLPAVAAGYWARAPRGYVHRSLEVRFFDEVGGPNEALKCVRRGDAVGIELDGGGLRLVTVGAQGGQHGCPGRCSAVCSGIGATWTFDCLKYDVCASRKSPGTCADEYERALDDYLAVLVSGRCNGATRDVLQSAVASRAEFVPEEKRLAPKKKQSWWRRRATLEGIAVPKQSVWQASKPVEAVPVDVAVDLCADGEKDCSPNSENSPSPV